MAHLFHLGDKKGRGCQQAFATVLTSGRHRVVPVNVFHSVISGILAGGIPGFGTVTFLLWHPTASILVMVVGFLLVLMDGLRGMAHKLPSFHHFSLWSDVDVSMHSTDGFSPFLWVLFCCFVVLVLVFLLFCLGLVAFVFVFFGLFLQWIMRMASL